MTSAARRCSLCSLRPPTFVGDVDQGGGRGAVEVCARCWAGVRSGCFRQLATELGRARAALARPLWDSARTLAFVDWKKATT